MHEKQKFSVGDTVWWFDQARAIADWFASGQKFKLEDHIPSGQIWCCELHDNRMVYKIREIQKGELTNTVRWEHVDILYASKEEAKEALIKEVLRLLSEIEKRLMDNLANVRKAQLSLSSL